MRPTRACRSMETKMRNLLFVLVLSLLSLGLAGCMGTATAGIDDAHVITGESSCFSYVRLDSSGQGVAVNLGGKHVLVTTKQVTWDSTECLPLPAVWNNLELVESGDSIVVNLDGNAFARIRPGA